MRAFNYFLVGAAAPLREGKFSSLQRIFDASVRSKAVMSLVGGLSIAFSSPGRKFGLQLPRDRLRDLTLNREQICKIAVVSLSP